MKQRQGMVANDRDDGLIDLEPYIYRPHPIFRLSSREDAAVACKTPEGEKEFREEIHLYDFI